MRLDAFRGEWAVERRIEDLRAGREGGFAGTARFDRTPSGLLYSEEGWLDYGGTRMRAFRRYLWRAVGAGEIEVRFEDGRFFHRFYADEARPAAIHDCGADRYRVSYDFRRWPRWQAEWRVSGPAKDYRLVSRYRPSGQEAEKPP